MEIQEMDGRVHRNEKDVLLQINKQLVLLLMVVGDKQIHP